VSVALSRLIRILFPFQHLYGRVQSRWWHRLATVMFFASVALVLLTVWGRANQSQAESFSVCVSSDFLAGRPPNPRCSLFAPTLFPNFLVATLVALTWSYLSQLVYRIALYVAFGPKSEWWRID
jgi:hypothetical protein